MKLLRRLPILSAAMMCAFTLLHAAPAAAEVTTNISTPFNVTIFVPCANNGTGEVVDLSGFLHQLTTLTISNAERHITSKTKFQPQGVSGTGRTTGYRYRGTGITQSTMNFDGVDTFPFVFTFVNNFRIIGQGPGNNFTLHENIHQTISSSGALTAFVDNFSVDCK
jgi:hypothetical protein